jgi:hypothetical protein
MMMMRAASDSRSAASDRSVVASAPCSAEKIAVVAKMVLSQHAATKLNCSGD